MMRGDRLLSILIQLQAYGQITAKELAERLEVSERTIYRDMEALSSSGIPVVAERGQNGGWSLLENYRTTLTGLTEEEMRALFISTSPHLLEVLGLSKTSKNARSKLIASIPSIYHKNAEEIWNCIHIDTSGWRNRQEKNAYFDVLKQAIWNCNQLLLGYERLDGSSGHQLVNPLGLVAKGSKWYLVALKNEDAFRNYRVSRITSAEILDVQFSRPKDFHLASYWETSTKAFMDTLPTYEVCVDVDPSILPRLAFTNRFMKKIETKSNKKGGWIRVKLTFDTKDEAVGYILSFADKIKVVEPVDLSDQIIHQAKAIISLSKSK